MSRRKQARPKSCKLEGMVEKREEGCSPQVSGDFSTSPGSAEWTKDPINEEDGFMPGVPQTAEGPVMTGVGDQGVRGADGSDTSVFRCDACSAVFDTLDHFMDHRNFACSASMAENGVTWSPEDKPEWSSSDSGSGSPLPPNLEEGVMVPLPLHLSEEQLPFAIGITETNPYGCQYCEKAFPQTSYLLVHERVHSSQLPFSCEHCQRVFREKRHRDRHVRLHASQRKLKCSQCDSSFSKKEELKAHMRKHESSKPYQCPLCNTGYSSAGALTSHLVTHQDLDTCGALPSVADLSSCNQCGQSFETMQLLREHMSIHSAVIKVEKLVCDICSQQFTSQDVLDAHMDHVHYRTPHPMDLDPSTLLLKCPMCSLRFSDTLSLCQHLMTHTATSLTLTTDLDPAALVRGGKDLLEISPKKDGSRSHTPKRSASAAELSPGGSRVSKTPQALVCPYCLSDSFESLEVLELHMQSVHSVKSNEIYTCNYCNAPYPNLYSLHDHMNVVHRNHPGIGIKYPCSLCNNQFPSIEALAKHKSLSHSYQDGNEGSHSGGIDSAFCGQCTLTFPSARQLEDHMVSVHGASVEKKSGKTRGRKPLNKGNKENKQTSKAKSVRQTSSSTAPAVTNDPATSTSPAKTPAPTDSITCDECNATFHELANFQAHMKLHLDAALAKFTCKKCGQQLGSQEQLEAHLSLHYLCLATEYGCTSCMKLFSKPDELQKHLMDIHAHHLYRCALCKEIFDSKVNIQVHFAIKHSNECKLFKCTQCPNIFRSEMEWQVHVRVNHLHLAKPYRCLFCAESFTSEMELQCHLTTHSKPFRCPMCEQAFHIEYLLDQHMQTDHADTDTKAAVAALLSPSLSSVSIKEEADSSTSVMGAIALARSPRPSSQSSDTRKSVSPAIPQPSVSPLALTSLSSAVWKNSEAVHVCNICDSRFTQQSLLAIHKVQEHGLKTAGTGGNSVSPSGKGRSSSISPSAGYPAPSGSQSQTSRDKFLQQNQTLVSVLTAETQSSHQMACTFCSQTFRNQTECDKHMKIHANSTSLKCNICDETFPSGSTLAEHKLQHCKIQQGNICFVCKLSLKTEEQFYSHAQEHGYQGSLLQCIVCRQTLASVVELQMHGKHHYQLRPSFYTCCVCLKTFHSKENLVSKLNSSGRTYYVCKPCYHGESPLHTCPQCSEKFASKAQLDAHAASHNVPTEMTSSKSSSMLIAPQSFQCIKCQESFSTEYEIQLHVANHMLQEGTTHECKLCTLIFESPAKLQCHLIEHTYKNEAEICCRICSKTFSSAAEIQLHALEHGSQGRRHTCGQCSQRFFFSAELDNHVLIYNHSPAAFSNNANSPPRQNECQECGKTFSGPAALANHRKMHEAKDSGIKCSLCSQVFSNVWLMQQHFLTFHITATDTGSNEKGNSSSSSKRNHSCSQCKLHFSTADSLQLHIMSVHKPESSHLSCPVCGKTFSQNKLLTAHMRSHTDSKPFVCSVCQKRFSREESLKAHMKSHGGQPLVCPLCNQCFAQRADITEHLKTHFSTPEPEQCTPISGPQTTQVSESENSLTTAVNNNKVSNGKKDVAGVALSSSVNGLHEEGSNHSAKELVIAPTSQHSPGNKCQS